MNRNWRVRTTTSSYAVKQILDVDDDSARCQHAATRALAATGLPVPAPYADRQGETLVHLPSGTYAVFPWVPGSHRHGLELDPGECEALGGLLARLHTQLGAVMPATAECQRPSVPETAQAADRIEHYLALLAPRTDHDAFDAFVHARLLERRKLLAEVAHLRPDPAGDPGRAGWVHGDFHHLNLLFDGPTVAAVLDWDRLKTRPYASELARSATLLFGYGDERGLDLRRVAGFAAGYHRTRGLSSEELEAAVHRLWWERVCDLWQLKAHYERGDTSCDHLFTSASALLTWWTAHRERVTAAFTEA